MIHVSYLLGFGKHHTLVIWPQMGHASLAVLAESRSLVPEDASPARDLVLPVVVRAVLFHDNFHVSYQHDQTGRGVSQSLCYFHDLFLKWHVLVTTPVIVELGHAVIMLKFY